MGGSGLRCIYIIGPVYYCNTRVLLCCVGAIIRIKVFVWRLIHTSHFPLLSSKQLQIEYPASSKAGNTGYISPFIYHCCLYLGVCWSQWQQHLVLETNLGLCIKILESLKEAHNHKQRCYKPKEHAWLYYDNHSQICFSSSDVWGTMRSCSSSGCCCCWATCISIWGMLAKIKEAYSNGYFLLRHGVHIKMLHQKEALGCMKANAFCVTNMWCMYHLLLLLNPQKHMKDKKWCAQRRFMLFRKMWKLIVKRRSLAT